MAPVKPYPPVHHHPHLTKTLKPSEVQEQLAAFLEQTKTKPHLHPDALLSGTGIQYSATSGPNGGLALHQLRRIEAGLRGENLIPETAADLRQFEEDGALPEGDDSALDTAIESKSARRGGLKRNRSIERVREWEDGSSQAALGAALEDGWQDQEEYERQQRPLEGDVGERAGAPVVQQGGVEPEIVEHNDAGEVEQPSAKIQKTEMDKAARKAAKKERRLQQLRENEAKKQAEG